MALRKMLLDDEEKMILIIKWPITWLNCVHVLMTCGKYNFQEMNFHI